MSSSPYPAPPACIDPRLGAQATQSLGLPPPATVAAHLAICASCRLQRAAFAGLDAHAVPPSPALRAHLRRLALRRLAAP
ncbi:hypothetical protein [Sorangium sp. So ce388]|uniref:hypothetical protein n=1 Tax=Sorangium sp. So ce388 TaxID=3133309 RepID=UPI003F5B27A2